MLHFYRRDFLLAVFNPILPLFFFFCFFFVFFFFYTTEKTKDSSSKCFITLRSAKTIIVTLPLDIYGGEVIHTSQIVSFIFNVAVMFILASPPTEIMF